MAGASLLCLPYGFERVTHRGQAVQRGLAIGGIDEVEVVLQPLHQRSFGQLLCRRAVVGQFEADAAAVAFDVGTTQTTGAFITGASVSCQQLIHACQCASAEDSGTWPCSEPIATSPIPMPAAKRETTR